MSAKAKAIGLAVLAAFGMAVVSAEAKKADKEGLPPEMMVPSRPHTMTLDKSALHRMDFTVKGSSCPACLLKIQKRLEKTKGVAQAAVMLNHPYASVCIYDATKVDKDKLLVIAKGDEEKVSFARIEDAPIAKLPAVLVPHHFNEPLPNNP